MEHRTGEQSAALERVETRGLTSRDRLGSKTRERRRRSNATHTRRGPVEKARRMKKRQRERERAYVCVYERASRSWASEHLPSPVSSRSSRDPRSVQRGISCWSRGTPLLLARGIRENPRTGELAREISHRDRSLVSLARVLSSPAHPSPLPRSLLIPRRPRIGHVQDYASTIERGRLLPPRDPPFAKEGK